MSGDEALARAKEAKGTSVIQTFKVTYKTEAELLEILEAKIAELKAKFQ